jgi:hypothetical protein
VVGGPSAIGSGGTAVRRASFLDDPAPLIGSTLPGRFSPLGGASNNVVQPLSVLQKQHQVDRFGIIEWDDLEDFIHPVRFTKNILREAKGDLEDIKIGVGALVAMGINQFIGTFTHPIQTARELPEDLVNLGTAVWEGVKQDFHDYTTDPWGKFKRDPLFVLLDIGGLISGAGAITARIGLKTGSTLGAKTFARYGAKTPGSFVRTIEGAGELVTNLEDVGRFIERLTPIKLGVKGTIAAAKVSGRGVEALIRTTGKGGRILDRLGTPTADAIRRFQEFAGPQKSRIMEAILAGATGKILVGTTRVREIIHNRSFIEATQAYSKHGGIEMALITEVVTQITELESGLAARGALRNAENRLTALRLALEDRIDAGDVNPLVGELADEMIDGSRTGIPTAEGLAQEASEAFDRISDRISERNQLQIGEGTLPSGDEVLEIADKLTAGRRLKDLADEAGVSLSNDPFNDPDLRIIDRATALGDPQAIPLPEDVIRTGLERIAPKEFVALFERSQAIIREANKLDNPNVPVSEALRAKVAIEIMHEVMATPNADGSFRRIRDIDAVDIEEAAVRALDKVSEVVDTTAARAERSGLRLKFSTLEKNELITKYFELNADELVKAGEDIATVDLAEKLRRVVAHVGSEDAVTTVDQLTSNFTSNERKFRFYDSLKQAVDPDDVAPATRAVDDVAPPARAAGEAVELGDEAALFLQVEMDSLLQMFSPEIRTQVVNQDLSALPSLTQRAISRIKSDADEALARIKEDIEIFRSGEDVPLVLQHQLQAAEIDIEIIDLIERRLFPAAEAVEEVADAAAPAARVASAGGLDAEADRISKDILDDAYSFAEEDVVSDFRHLADLDDLDEIRRIREFEELEISVTKGELNEPFSGIGDSFLMGRIRKHESRLKLLDIAERKLVQGSDVAEEVVEAAAPVARVVEDLSDVDPADVAAARSAISPRDLVDDVFDSMKTDKTFQRVDTFIRDVNNAKDKAGAITKAKTVAGVTSRASRGRARATVGQIVNDKDLQDIRSIQAEIDDINLSDRVAGSGDATPLKTRDPEGLSPPQRAVVGEPGAESIPQGRVIPEVTPSGIPITDDMRDTIEKMLKLNEFQQEFLTGVHLRSGPELLDSSLAQIFHKLLGIKRPKVIATGDVAADLIANRKARADVTERGYRAMGISRDQLITTKELKELGGIEGIEAAGGKFAGTLGERAAQLMHEGRRNPDGSLAPPTPSGLALESPDSFYLVPMHMSGVLKAEIETLRIWEGSRGLLQGGDAAIEAKVLQKELALQVKEGAVIAEEANRKALAEALSRKVHGDPQQELVIRDGEASLPKTPPSSTIDLAEELDITDAGPTVPVGGRVRVPDETAIGDIAENAGVIAAVDELGAAVVDDVDAAARSVDMRRLPGALGVQEVRNPKIGRGVSGSGKFNRAQGGPLQGLIYDDVDNQVMVAQVLQTYKAVETGADLEALRVINEITETSAHKIVVDKAALGIADDAAKLFRPDGTILKSFGTIEEMQEYLDSGVDFGFGKVKMAVWAPTDLKASRMITRTVMNDTLSGMMEGKNIFEALSESLKRNSTEFVDNLDQMGKGGIVDDVSLGKGMGELYLIPQQVGQTLQDFSNRGRPMTGMAGTTIGYYDKVTKFYKGVWLRSPRFIVNNNVTNVLMAILAGVHPSSLKRALDKGLKDIFPEGVDGGEVREFVKNLPQITGTEGSTVANAVKFMKQGNIFTGLHELGGVITEKVAKPIANTFDSFNQLTENFWRRAAFIDRTRSLNNILKGADDGHLERLAKELNQQAGSRMDSKQVLNKLVAMRENLLDGAMNDAMIKNVGIVSSSVELTTDALKHVNKYYFDYGNMLPIEKEVLRRIFPFWQWQKNIHNFAIKMPKDHPGRVMIAAHLAEVANEITDQEELPVWLKSSVLFTAAKGTRIGKAFGVDRARLRAGGANPLMGLADPEGFHPILGFMMSYATGGKTFPSGGRFHDPEIVESFNRKFRIDPKSGRVTDEVEVIRPKVSQEFLKAIPHIRIAMDVSRRTAELMPPGAIADYIESLVGETPKRRVGQFGVFDPKSPFTSTLQWFGISTAPAPPTQWRQRIEILKRSAEKKYRQLQQERQERGILGEFTGL